MTRALLLATPGTALLLFGVLAVPLIWPLEDVLPDFPLRLLLWGCASGGLLLLFLAAYPALRARGIVGPHRRGPGRR